MEVRVLGWKLGFFLYKFDHNLPKQTTQVWGWDIQLKSTYCTSKNSFKRQMMLYKEFY